MATLKGQNFRVLIYNQSAHSYEVVGYATNCVVTLTNDTTDASTKGDAGLSQNPEVTRKSWQIQVDSLTVGDTILIQYAKSGSSLMVEWDKTTGTDHSTPTNEDYGRKGSAFITDITFAFNNREFVARNITMQGTGPLETLT